MNETRFGDTVGQLSRHLVVGEGPFTNLVLIAYIVVATLIAGAASPGAGLGILALGLFTVLTLDFVHWRKREGRGRWDSDDLASLAARMIASRGDPSAPADTMGSEETDRPDRSPRTGVSPALEPVKSGYGKGAPTADPSQSATV